jgi:mRNA-degrading endonuclease HigB of HigAB toxin-antitoxin module
VRVRSSDAGGLWFEKTLTVTVTGVNEAPTDLSLSNSNVAENAGADAVVGALSSTDPDGDTGFTYTLVTGTGDTDNGAFNISGSSLRLSISDNFEVKSSYSLRVRSTDAGGLWFEKAFAVTITGINEAPTDLSLAPSSIAENAGTDAVVGALITTDPDGDTGFSYTLATGTGDTDNAAFNISGSSLRLTSSANFEAKSSYTVRIRSTDAGGLWFEKAFAVTITGVNEAPTNISLSNSTVAENAGADAVVGALSSTDPDGDTGFTYTLVTGTGDTDNGAFNISGSSLRLTSSADFEVKSSYSLRVRSTDAGGLWFEKAFAVTITGVNEAPTNISLSNSWAQCNSRHPYHDRPRLRR